MEQNKTTPRAWAETACLILLVLSFFSMMFVTPLRSAIFFPLVFAALIAYSLYRDVRVECADELEVGIPRYTPILNAGHFFFMIALVLVFSHVFWGGISWLRLASFLADLTISVSIYYLILALCLPALRRWFNARTCGVLWMLPLLLVIFYYAEGTSLHRRPLFVLDIPQELLLPLLAVWLGGAALVLGWNILSHLRFRRFLLKDAVPAEDEATRTVWTQVCREAHRKDIPPVSRSANAKTPLSIGLFHPHVVLPEKDYTQEDLALVLKHELVHIMRQDSQNKFFLAFLRALGWFNPLMWLAMRKSSDDFELSCDETVLQSADEDQRQRYAGLLLHTAGDQRGFTTCLSASASALRYRMRAVVLPSRRFVGGLLAGVLVFLLFSMSGHVALSLGRGSGEELLFPGGREACSLVSVLDQRFGKRYESADGDAILDYLSDLPLQQISGNFSFAPDSFSWEEDSQELYFQLESGEQRFSLSLTALGLQANNGPQPDSYLVDADIDWAYLESLLGPAA